MLMMYPPPRFRMRGIASLEQRNTPVRFVSITEFQS